MQRFTISLDDTLAAQFDTLLAELGYASRSEAVRDLIRARLGQRALPQQSANAPATSDAPPNALWCVAVVSFVYDHHDRTVASRVLNAQHDQHHMVIVNQHAHLDHADCLETVMLRGPSAEVQAFAQNLLALRGVRHGQVHLVPLVESDVASNPHDAQASTTHTHRHPLN